MAEKENESLPSEICEYKLFHGGKRSILTQI